MAIHKEIKKKALDLKVWDNFFVDESQNFFLRCKIILIIEYCSAPNHRTDCSCTFSLLKEFLNNICLNDFYINILWTFKHNLKHLQHVVYRKLHAHEAKSKQLFCLLSILTSMILLRVSVLGILLFSPKMNTKITLKPSPPPTQGF